MSIRHLTDSFALTWDCNKEKDNKLKVSAIFAGKEIFKKCFFPPFKKLVEEDVLAELI